ncbi:hypothetical protein, partial [Rhodopseudomonas sp. BAL398]|uniref:hypothetical protein n=1 Tax=Rhodopseudomonas sp. BAL398 TaxID=3034676 RepID=UPI0023E31CD8
ARAGAAGVGGGPPGPGPPPILFKRGVGAGGPPPKRSVFKISYKFLMVDRGPWLRRVRPDRQRTY